MLMTQGQSVLQPFRAAGMSPTEVRVLRNELGRWDRQVLINYTMASLKAGRLLCHVHGNPAHTVGVPSDDAILETRRIEEGVLEERL